MGSKWYKKVSKELKKFKGLEKLQKGSRIHIKVKHNSRRSYWSIKGLVCLFYYTNKTVLGLPQFKKDQEGSIRFKKVQEGSRRGK